MSDGYLQWLIEQIEEETKSLKRAHKLNKLKYHRAPLLITRASAMLAALILAKSRYEYFKEEEQS